MPRATTKSELLSAANANWAKMWDLIESIPGGVRAITFDFGDNPKLKEAHWKRDKNIRDVMVHLYEWHRLLLDWVGGNMGMSSPPRPFLPEPYNWKNYADMNIAIWEKHQTTTYDDATSKLRDSHGKVMALFESLTDAELFEKKHFPWTGSTNVGSYCISATSSHYDWAIKKIKQWIKTNK